MLKNQPKSSEPKEISRTLLPPAPDSTSIIEGMVCPYWMTFPISRDWLVERPKRLTKRIKLPKKKCWEIFGQEDEIY